MTNAEGLLQLVNAKTGKKQALNCVMGLNFLHKLGVVEKVNGPWQATEKCASYEVPLYFATYGSHDDLTVSITKGDQKMRTLLLKHLKPRLLFIDEALCSKMLSDKVREGLQHYAPPLLS